MAHRIRCSGIPAVWAKTLVLKPRVNEQVLHVIAIINQSLRTDHSEGIQDVYKGTDTYMILLGSPLLPDRQYSYGALHPMLILGGNVALGSKKQSEFDMIG